MHNKSLCIIGNGFDLHHGMKTSYWDFRDYLETTNKELLDVIETYLVSDELWSDFEEALATLDINTMLDYASGFLVSYSAEDWSDSYHHDYQYEIDQIVGSLSHRLKEAFTAWIKEVKVPIKSQVADKILPLEKDALYLSFNYTPTLEKLYSVPIAKTTFIHGSITNGDNNLVLGHAWNPKDNSPMINEKYPEDMDTRVLEGNELINKYFSETYKPTDKIITDNKSFFESLDSIQDIYIFGHSLSTVDIPYFKAIIDHIDIEKVRWIASYRSEKKRLKLESNMKDLGIHSSNIQFVKLDSLSRGII
jgi:hypothetical protein